MFSSYTIGGLKKIKKEQFFSHLAFSDFSIFLLIKKELICF
jgi:hypothetical protein